MFLNKIKLQLPYDLARPSLGVYPKESKSPYNRETCTPMFIAARFTIAKLWDQPRCPLRDEWMTGGVAQVVEHMLCNHEALSSNPNPQREREERDEQIKKMWYIYTMEYYSAIKNNKITGSWWLTHNPSYSGGREQEDRCLKPAPDK
jgi:hypothetical protein